MTSVSVFVLKVNVALAETGPSFPEAPAAVWKTRGDAWLDPAPTVTSPANASTRRNEGRLKRCVRSFLMALLPPFRVITDGHSHSRADVHTRNPLEIPKFRG